MSVARTRWAALAYARGPVTWRLRSFAASIWAVALSAAFPGVARADPGVPEPVRPVWIRGPGAERCVDDATLADRVSARLGRPSFSETASRRIEGLVQRDADRWVAHLYARDADGKLTGARNLTSDGVDCAGLDAAVMLAIALVIDPEAALRPPAAATTPAPPPPPPPPPDFPPPPLACPVATPCPPVPPPAPAVIRDPFTITGRAVLAGGLLPTTAGGVAIAVDLPAYRALHITTGAMFLPEVRTSTGDFGFGITAPWIGACAVPWRGSRLGVSFCEDILLGAIHAVDYALVPTTPGDRFWGGTATEVDLRARLIGPLALEIGGQLLFPLTRQEFTVQGQTGTVFQEWVATGIGFIGVGASIP